MKTINANPRSLINPKHKKYEENHTMTHIIINLLKTSDEEKGFKSSQRMKILQIEEQRQG